MIFQPTLLISLGSGVAISLGRSLYVLVSRLAAGGPVRMIFLVADNPRCLISLNVCRTDVVSELITNQPRGRVIHTNRACLNYRDSLFIVHHVKAFSFETDDSADAVLAIDLNSTDIDALRLPGWFYAGRRLIFGYLSDALTATVVYIPRSFGRSAHDALLRRCLQLFAEIPLHHL